MTNAVQTPARLQHLIPKSLPPASRGIKLNTVLGKDRANFTYVDLFAGCGGLSLGLKRAGGTHVMGVEKSPMASQTYFRNLINRDSRSWHEHLGKGVTAQGEAGLVVGTVESVLNDTTTMKRLANASLDLAVGGPPCQGFSLAGRRNSSDPRNQLAWQFLKFIDATNPRFVIIENVVGIHRKLKATSSRTPFESLMTALADQGTWGYRVQGVLLNAKHYGAPQSRPRMMLIGVREDVAEQLHIEPQSTVITSRFLGEAGPVYGSLLPASELRASDVRTVAQALADLYVHIQADKRRNIDASYREDVSNAEQWRLASPQTKTMPANHVLRKHRASTEHLFRLLKLLKDHNLVRAARRARKDDFSEEALTDLMRLISPLPFPLKSPDLKLIVESPEELLAHIRTLITLKHSQTVLDWEEPSRTVVTIPDDYIHPLLPRTFSVRELARLQGFPDAFEFYGKVTTGGASRRVDVPQYSQVGNAVSPFVGMALGQMIRTYVTELASQQPLNRR